MHALDRNLEAMRETGNCHGSSTPPLPCINKKRYAPTISITGGKEKKEKKAICGEQMHNPLEGGMTDISQYLVRLEYVGFPRASTREETRA
jgi:hypothetical protein